MTAELQTVEHGAISPAFAVTGEAWAYAKALAAAAATPKAYRGKPADVFLIMQAAVALDVPVFAALAGVNVVEGKAEAGAELMLSLIHRAGHRARHGGDRREAWCEITRADDPDYTYRETFDLYDAEQAELCEIVDYDKGRVKARSKPTSYSAGNQPLPWEKYTRVMLRWRAISLAASFACPEVLMGVRYVNGEVGGPIDGTTLQTAEVSYAQTSDVDDDQAVAEAPQTVPERPDVVDATDEQPTLDATPTESLSFDAEQWGAQLEAAGRGTNVEDDLRQLVELATQARAAGREDLVDEARELWVIREARG